MDTAFYLGGGLAFLIALLGWGDQIRGAQEETRLLEQNFLKDYGFRWKDLQPLIQPNGEGQAAAQLASVLRLLGSGTLTSRTDVNIIAELRRLSEIRTRLEPRHEIRFWLVFATSVEMLISGILSTFLVGRVFSSQPLFWNHVFASMWIILVGVILFFTYKISIDEKSFRNAINRTDTILREATDNSHNGAK